MVLYGIKVNNRTLIYNRDILGFIHVGEANRYYNVDKYACNFAKMVQSWREIWNNRTNATTDLQFPFGFVQVGVIQNC
jgi:hypothetical protein